MRGTIRIKSDAAFSINRLSSSPFVKGLRSPFPEPDTIKTLLYRRIAESSTILDTIKARSVCSTDPEMKQGSPLPCLLALCNSGVWLLATRLQWMDITRALGLGP